jgi:putative tryptophan/tyrosine transport system substrate-binding protein
MTRRDFITLLGGAAAAWPLAARAQQAVTPVIGFLSSVSPEELANFVAAFHEGLRETGYVEGRNVAIEYRFARGHNDRLPEFAADLVRRGVDVIAAPGSPPGTVAAKAATTTIPIVFFLGGDPVASGFVASLNRPGGNLTGVTTLGADLGPKRLELLHEVVPMATVFAALINPTGSNADAFIKNAQAGARALGLRLEAVHASTDGDLDSVFETLVRLQAGGLVIAPDQFLYARSGQIAARAVRHALPTIFQYRESAMAGGLMSYGGNAMDAFRLAVSIPAAFSRARSPPTSRSSKPPKSNSSSILRPPRRLVLRCQPLSLSAPTR